MGQQALGIALDPEGYIKAERQAPPLQCRRLDCMQRLGGVQGDVHLVRLQVDVHFGAWRRIAWWRGGLRGMEDAAAWGEWGATHAE